jgi:DNA-binding transcriptional regulator GbsR (MarR family)
MAKRKKGERVVDQVLDALTACAREGTGMTKSQMMSEIGCSKISINQALSKIQRLALTCEPPLVLAHEPFQGGNREHLFFLTDDVVETAYASASNIQHIAARQRTEAMRAEAVTKSCVGMTSVQRAVAAELEMSMRHDEERSQLRLTQLELYLEDA